MSAFQVSIAALAAVILFLYALGNFSRELQKAGDARLRRALNRATSNRWRAFGVGAAATALLQSSSAVSALAVALVDASVLTFGASLGIVLGAKVGTTSTAWLVSFKLTGIGPFFIVLGTIVSLVPYRGRVLGQSIFYFGLVFFTLDLIAGTLRPLGEHPWAIEWLGHARNPYLGIALGLVFTALIQSSSVTTGLAILLVQEELLPATSAIPIVLGANVGTTSTALLASLSSGKVARATAVANVLFNVLGVAALTPWVDPFARAVVAWAPGPDKAVAAAQLLFNATIGTVFLIFLPQLEPRLVRWFRLDSNAGPSEGVRT